MPILQHLTEDQLGYTLVLGVFLILNIFIVLAIFHFCHRLRQATCLSLAYTIICMGVCGWLINQPMNRPVHQQNITVVMAKPNHI